MISPNEIPALVQRLAAADIELFECNWSDGALLLRFGGAETGGGEGTVVAQQNRDDVAQPVLKSPGIGVLRLCHPLGATQQLAEGDHIEVGQPVAYLETGDVLLPVHANQSGVMARWLSHEGELTGYGAPLIELF